MRTITLHINGADHPLEIEDNWTLLYVLREVLNLTGTKYGCGTNDCGACKVLVNGAPRTPRSSGPESGRGRHPDHRGRQP